MPYVGVNNGVETWMIAAQELAKTTVVDGEETTVCFTYARCFR